MSGRQYLVSAALAGCLVLPVIIGASCPPPSNPPFISMSIGTSTTNLSVLPCEPDRVCVDVINQACVNADVVLYSHDGYDLEGEYPTWYSYGCCNEPWPTTRCPCQRPGALNGEMQLTKPELFQVANRTPFVEGGETVITLEGERGRTRRSFPCDEIKSVGLQVGYEGDLPASPQETSTPHYRCSTIEVEDWWWPWDAPQRVEEDVACGATIQFRVYDRSDCMHPDLTVFRIEVETSADCSDVELEGEEEGEGGGMGGGRT